MNLELFAFNNVTQIGLFPIDYGTLDLIPKYFYSGIKTLCFVDFKALDGHTERT